MACRIFGAIDVGSYEVNLKIYELSARNGIRVLNHVRHRMELGRDTYATGKISTELTDELCAVLLDFKQMMKEFGVEDYRACATSAIRETRNTLVFLDRIFLRTGIRLEILSNSEQRFLGYVNHGELRSLHLQHAYKRFRTDAWNHVRYQLNPLNSQYYQSPLYQLLLNYQLPHTHVKTSQQQ